MTVLKVNVGPVDPKIIRLAGEFPFLLQPTHPEVFRSSATRLGRPGQLQKGRPSDGRKGCLHTFRVQLGLYPHKLGYNTYQAVIFMSNSISETAPQVPATPT